MTNNSKLTTLQNRDSVMKQKTNIFSGIKLVIQKEISIYSRLIASFDKELQKMPRGSLSIARKGKYKYIHHNFDGNTEYLSMKKKSDIRTAEKLRRKRFLTKCLRVLRHDIRVLQRAIDDLYGFDPKAISDSLPEVYQNVPGREPEILPGFDPRPASHYTFKSKSEELIAIILEANGLVFQYEMEIIANGRHYRPDFTILHPVTNELIYWEHFGLIIKADYYADNTQRLIDYHADGIVYGRNFIFTSETKEDPLTSNTIQAIIDHFFLQ